MPILVISEMTRQYLIEYYIEKLRAQNDVNSTVVEAIGDPQLFLYGELLEHIQTCQQGVVKPELIEALEILSYGDFKDATELIRGNENCSLKLRMLTIFSIINQIGFVVPFHVLREQLELVESIDVMSLLLQMSAKKLLSLRIDEKNDVVILTSIFLFREIPRNVSMEQIRHNLSQLIQRIKTSSTMKLSNHGNWEKCYKILHLSKNQNESHRT